MKFGINTTSVVLENGDKFHEAKPSEIYHFQYNKSGIYPNFTAIPMLFPVNTILAAHRNAVH